MFRRAVSATSVLIAGRKAIQVPSNSTQSTLVVSSTVPSSSITSCPGASYRHCTTESNAPSKNHVWGLWNEGNLFSLSVPELTAFLMANDKEVDPKMKKSALVREVEEIMAKEQPTVGGNETEDTVASITAESTTYDTAGADMLEEADVYGDWGADPGFEARKELDFMELSPSRMQQHYDPLSPRAFQLLHSEATADLGLASFDPSKLPGQSKNTTSFTATSVVANDSNRIRFRRALKWAATNLWSLNMAGELNIGAGKALYWRSIAKHNRNILPVWTCQQHLYNTHPYSWFAVAHEENVPDAEAMAKKLGMTLSQDYTTSYKLLIKRSRDQLDCELNANLQCTLLQMPWDRFLVSHVLRSSMPDLRYLIRARHPIRKRIAEPYMDIPIIRLAKESVQPVLSPELGEVLYCCERIIRKWSMTLGGNITLSLVETKRMPLIVTRDGEEGDRIEYELIVNIPSKMDGVDLGVFADEMWSYGNDFAEALEDGMQNLQAHIMPSSAAFDPVGN
eukprot:Tbor_TRINITY_DN5708_c1_g1::TRINITY_DN5708_c1_g1_i1::g.19959::m.19959